jgi:hypothetical protein
VITASTLEGSRWVARPPRRSDVHESSVEHPGGQLLGAESACPGKLAGGDSLLHLAGGLQPPERIGDRPEAADPQISRVELVGVDRDRRAPLASRGADSADPRMRVA